MDWIIVVDNDLANLKMAGQILSKNGMRVSTLRTGQAMLNYINEKGAPDLILLDVNLPVMDGFETLKKLRELEGGRKETPVIFLTGEEDLASEVTSLQLGAMDYLRKPFSPEVLIERVHRVLRMQGQMDRLEQAASIDKMTGLLNKEASEARMRDMCDTESGFLCVLDLDSFKLVNDLYGHETGDRVLVLFSSILQQQKRHDDVCGRIGGDEFIIFLRNMKSENELNHFFMRISEVYLTEVSKMIVKQIPLGVSAGAVAIPDHGRDYEHLFRLADESLYLVKQNGKHGLSIAERKGVNREASSGEMNLETITSILEERSAPSSAMWMGTEAFTNIYQYMIRYMERYHGMAYRTLFTLRMAAEDSSEEERSEVMTHFRKVMQSSLRYSDVMVEISDNQLFLLLPETKDYNIERVIHRLLDKWDQSGYGDHVIITYETGQVHLSHGAGPEQADVSDKVVVVDDDKLNLKTAESLLSDSHIQLKTLSTGTALLEHLKHNKPDLILLDVRMPDMTGFETVEQMRKMSSAYRDIPVIFLTEEESRETELRGLKLGAADFIRKPFVPEVLALRIRNTIELNRLQNNLTQEVTKKTAENNLLFLHTVKALAETIDAKDPYTDGHSVRVAHYAQEIARRIGYTEEMANNIYVMGLVHDVGRTAVPDAVLNKKGPLTWEEFEKVKLHPQTGAKILEAIREMPSLSIGARWHHERYDGKGYPDGLSGTNIPEEARIIAVADAYDAMTSSRSYHSIFPQETVREELEKNKGTQFDPVFADIMISMIDEDTEYSMRGPQNI